MLLKLTLVSLLSLALAAPQHPPAAQYPAGVNPQDCPGFPICDNARLHNPQAQWGAPQPSAWNHQPSWEDDGQWRGDNGGQWSGDNGGQWGGEQNHWGGDHNQWGGAQNHWGGGGQNNWGAPAPAWNGGAAGHGAPAGADKFPAGVNPHACPNYPFCDVNGGQHGGGHAAPPLPGWSERLYPAGVSPHECPNFPYCH